MILRGKDPETHDMFPSSNFYPDDPTVTDVIDETTAEGKELAQKIRDLTPFYGMVRDDTGVLIDVVDIKIKVTLDFDHVAVGQTVTVVATLTEAVDNEVVFRVDDGPELVETVVNGQADGFFAFSLPGVYTITVSSQSHGSASVEVTVSE